MHEKPNISEQHLQTCLQDQYDLQPMAFDFLPLGLDTMSAKYRITDAQGTSYFLKAKSGLYAPAFLVPRYLHDQGIPAVVAPISTNNHTLWTLVDDWIVILYPFIEGDTSWLGMNDEHWKEVGTVFKHIHQAALPPSGFASIHTESFDPTSYTRWIHTFEIQHLHEHSTKNALELSLRAMWLTHQPKVHTIATSLEMLATRIQRRALPQVICHADLHPGNILRDHTKQVFVIDWNDVMLAPKERDFIFVQEQSSAKLSTSAPSPFFQGYGYAEIDQTVLTYYRHERVIQDLIECAQQVFFRDDLSIESKADAIQLFGDVLLESTTFLT